MLFRVTMKWHALEFHFFGTNGNDDAKRKEERENLVRLIYM